MAIWAVGVAAAGRHLARRQDICPTGVVEAGPRRRKRASAPSRRAPSLRGWRPLPPTPGSVFRKEGRVPVGRVPSVTLRSQAAFVIVVGPTARIGRRDVHGELFLVSTLTESRVRPVVMEGASDRLLMVTERGLRTRSLIDRNKP